MEITNKHKRLSVSDIALVGLLSASITSGKLALSFIPNVEIVTFLFIIYTVCFGLRRSMFSAIVFTTTEIMLYGFSTWLLVYYMIWPLLILITGLLRNRLKTEYGYAAVAGLFGLTFGLFFAVVESFFYGAAYGVAYWIRGIPFDLVHGVSNYIIVLCLFKPMRNILMRQRRLFKRDA